jgi:hypothetical protein
MASIENGNVLATPVVSAAVLHDAEEPAPAPAPTPAPAHAALLAEVLRDAAVRKYRRPGFVAAADAPVAGMDRLEVWVQEGPYCYPLTHEQAGWGAVLTPICSASVSVYRLAGVPEQRLLLGQAEVRVNNGQPAYNAEQFVCAARALLRQGIQEREGRAPETPLRPNPPMPGALARITQFGRRARGSLRARLGADESQWTIGVLPAAAVAFDRPFPWDEVRWILPPRDRFIADPFLVERDGELWLFYERLLTVENKGTLWTARFDPRTASMTDAAEILRTEFHLSFPNVFQFEGEWYMLPEQARSGKTTLYRATQFPYRWEPWRDLLPDFPGIDPVLHRQDGRWWLFVSHGAHPCTENNLYLFSSESLDGEFVPHPMNPIRSGLRGSRMAGPLQASGTRLIRPGQDGREGYGKGLVLNEIRALDAQRYEESELCLWPPQAGGRFGHGFHTYMVCGDWLVIDAKRLLPRR